MKKKIWISRGFWFGVITMILPAVSTQAEALIQEHTATYNMLWGALVILLRMVTKDAVKLID